MNAPILAALVLGLLATAAHAESCVADFSLLGQGNIAVEVKPAAQEGRVDVFVNGQATHAGTLPVDEAIRPGLNFAVDPYGSEFKQLNSAERSLVHMKSLSEAPPTRDVVKLPFTIGDVRRIKTIDLTGKMDKFGGQVLMEAFDERGVSLGKVLRRAFVAACR